MGKWFAEGYGQSEGGGLPARDTAGCQSAPRGKRGTPGAWRLKKLARGCEGDEFGDRMFLFMHVSAALVVIVLGTALGVFIVGVLYALTDMLDGGREKPEYKPLYSIVQTWRNRGQSAAALAEVRQQLERFPNEFEGVMLMAEIQARDLNDLPAAVVTLQNFCRTEGVAARPVALALTRLAEWQLKLADTTAARASLNEIVERFPGTEMGRSSGWRISRGRRSWCWRSMIRSRCRCRRGSIIWGCWRSRRCWSKRRSHRGRWRRRM